ncbi:MAG: OmpA family protein [Gammaproteobacteria bacterium]|nr:OmpA family protein [Gammaproteobacteria bacterium]
MKRSHGNLNIALLASLILAAAAAGGWYYYFSELDKYQALEKDSEAVWQELTDDLVQKQSSIDQLTQTEQALLASLESEKKSQQLLRAAFEQIKTEKAQINAENEQIKAEKAQINAENEQIKAEKSQIEINLQQEVNRVVFTTAELEKELQQRQARQKSLEDKINTVSGEKSNLASELEQEQKRRQQLQRQIANVSDDVGQKEKALADAELDVSLLNQQLEATRQEQILLKDHIEELSQQRERDSEHFATLEYRLEQELNESRVEIEQLKNRMTVIKLTSDVLFSSGSADIKPAGQKVLSVIAESLSAFPDRAISIEGHTDHVPIGENSRYASNWELSTIRALAALNYFQQNNQIDPKRLKLVGYGEYRPAYSNATAEGRERNRRIEIIILPP